MPLKGAGALMPGSLRVAARNPRHVGSGRAGMELRWTRLQMMKATGEICSGVRRLEIAIVHPEK